MGRQTSRAAEFKEHYNMQLHPAALRPFQHYGAIEILAGARSDGTRWRVCYCKP
jgi:hypothetical protein